MAEFFRLVHSESYGRKPAEDLCMCNHFVHHFQVR